MSDRWQRIEQLYHAALKREESQRAAFLKEACPGDDALRQEVQSLLAQGEGSGGFLEAPALEVAAKMWSEDPSRSLLGRRIGSYQILSLLGAGGMGEVYEARDNKLGRNVAIKVLPAVFAHDPERLSRFEREARMLASLNRPNIATIYGLEQSDGVHYLVMELVPGETLAERLGAGPLGIEEALKIGAQIAEALEAAHEKGVIHRDLKPANMKVTPEGRVKVLDFGLAKAFAGDGGLDLSHRPALTAMGTEEGRILGTPAYMSPEQARGKPVDKRTDIWAFGCVLYELLTGKQAFAGETLSDTIAGVLEKEPDWQELPRPTPANIRILLRRCLQKDTTVRLRDIGDARIEIDQALSAPATAEPTNAVAIPLVSHRKLRERLAWSVAALLAVGLAPVAFLYFREKPPASAAPVRFPIPAPGNTTFGPYLKVSPDGRKLAFVAGDRLWVHFLESGESRDLTDAEGPPFWSPDSRYIGYLSENKVKKIEATGGPPQTVAESSNFSGGGAWNQGDVIVFGATGGLFRVPASGGVPVQITAVDPARRERFHFCPSFLPDGRHFVYIRDSADREKSGIYLGSVDAKPEQQSSKLLVASNWGPVYAPSADSSTGYLLFMRKGTLMAQPFDNRRLELKGQATLVAEQVADDLGGGGDGAFSASTNDVLVYWRSTPSDRQLTWYDRQGKVLGTAGEPGNYGGLALSPDGTRVALSKRSGQASNIWLLDLSRDTSTRFTFGSGMDSYPLWSPDGSRIIFGSGNYLYQEPVSGVKDAELLLSSSQAPYAESWSRDGRFLLYQVFDPKTGWDIWVLPLEGDKKPVPFLVTEFRERDARFSPDGHWVAYISNESGDYEVYVRSFAMNSTGTAVEAGGKWQISNGYGRQPRWRGDGRELYYSARDRQVMAVEIATNPEFKPGKPHPLGFKAGAESWTGIGWDSTADGRRFLVAAPRTGPKSNGPEPYTVILNWQAGLKK